MKRLAAWLLFLPACVLPSWYLRDIVAAEAQIRGFVPDTARYLPRKMEFASCYPSPSFLLYGRKLGPRGQERLWEVFSEGRDEERRKNASNLLLQYHGPALTEWFIQAIHSADPLMLKWAMYWAHFQETDRDLTACLRAISEEDFARLLRCAEGIGPVSRFIVVLWKVRPEEAERAGARWMRTTTNARALLGLAIDFCYETHDCDERSRFRQFMLKMRQAAEENPRHVVQIPWPKELPIFEEQYGNR